LFIRLKRDISPIFSDIRLAGEMFQKPREVPAYLPPSGVKCRSRVLILLIFSFVPLLQTMLGKSFSIMPSGGGLLRFLRHSKFTG
jgi:hypothetical protein